MPRSTPNVTEEPQEWSNALEGCCRSAGLSSGCCVASASESVVERLPGDDDYVGRGYEFPILRRMKSDGTAPPPEHAGPGPEHAGTWMPVGVGVGPTGGQVGGLSSLSAKTGNAGPSQPGGGPEILTPREQNAGPRGAEANKTVGPTMEELQAMEREPARPKAQPVKTSDIQVKEASASQQPGEQPSGKKQKTVVDEAYVMKDAWWCTYCCCGGCGCGRSAYARLMSKCMFCRTTCEHSSLVEEDQGCLHIIYSCLLCHLFCQLPCRQGMPRCICCGEIMISCGKYPHKKNVEIPHHAIGEEPAPPMFEFLTFEAFTPCYCCCCGCSCKDECLSCCTITQICCCCNCKCEDTVPTCSDGFCTFLHTCGICHTQCSCLPVREHNPIFACCGMKLRKPGAGRGQVGGTGGSQAPAQQRMG